MIIWSFNLLILSVIFLIVGLIKPKWLLFWMEKPSRFIIIAIAMVLFMAAAILFGEGNRRKEPLSQVAQDNQETSAESPTDLVK